MRGARQAVWAWRFESAEEWRQRAWRAAQARERAECISGVEAQIAREADPERKA